MMTSVDKFTQSLKKARSYGLNEFLEIMGEMSQESVKKGLLSRKDKELITLGMALAKECNRCIKIHSKAAKKLDASEKELTQIHKIVLFINASPVQDEIMWQSWQDSWSEFSLIKGPVEHYLRELIALGISLVRQLPDHINLHASHALKYGATREQVFEVMPLALLMDGAPAISQVPTLVDALGLD